MDGVFGTDTINAELLSLLVQQLEQLRAQPAIGGKGVDVALVLRKW